MNKVGLPVLASLQKRNKAIKCIKVLKNSTLRDYLSANPTYIFHHIPKCGGSSARVALSNWFYTVDDYRPNIIVDEITDKYLKNRIDITHLKARHCLCGHFQMEGNFLHQRYPEVLMEETRYKIFTFVRDPLEMMISLYYYNRKRGLYLNITLEEFLIKHVDNILASVFPCNEENYRQVLSRYFFIGITEYLQESFNCLALILNKKKVKVPLVNQAERDKQSYEVSPSIIEEFKQINDLDYKIYEYSLDKFRESKIECQTYEWNAPC